MRMRPDLKGKNVLVPLCGGNIDTTVLGRVIELPCADEVKCRALVASLVSALAALLVCGDARQR